MNVGNTDIKIIKADITDYEADALVSPVSRSLAMNAGVAGAIKKKAGGGIKKEALSRVSHSPGVAISTQAKGLKARYVIHAVVLTDAQKTDENIIRSAFADALACAERLKIKILAVPALGCGAGDFPPVASAKIMTQEILKTTRQKKAFPQKVVFCLYDEKTYRIFEKTINGYLAHILNPFKQPYLTVDALIHFQDGVVVIKRSNPPFGWALPGGFVDYGESLEDAVVREAKEETNLDITDLRQLKTYSAPGRDPRFHTVSTVFTAKGEGILKAGDDAAETKIIEDDNLDKTAFAFDHKKIISAYFRDARF